MCVFFTVDIYNFEMRLVAIQFEKYLSKHNKTDQLKTKYYEFMRIKSLKPTCILQIKLKSRDLNNNR